MNKYIKFAIDNLKESIEFCRRDSINSYKSIDKTLAAYILYSREALIDTFDEQYVKECIVKHDEARHFLKTCGKPKDDFEILNIWLAKHDVARFAKFAESKSYS